MVAELAFSKLTCLLTESKSHDEDGYLCIELNESSLIDKEHILSLLIECGYMGNHNSISNGFVYINRSSDSWKNGICPLYLDSEHFWQQVQSAEKLPQHYYLVKESISSCDAEPKQSVYLYKSFFIWKEILAKISDHTQSNKAIIFITTENSVLKLEIPLNIKNNDLQRIEKPKIIFEEITKLHKLIEIDDPHNKERTSVLRTTLSEIAAHTDENENLLYELIRRTDEVTKKYDDLYDVYTRRFSVNKILNELDEKSIEFTSKINEYISSSQNKALTIPGALIAIGALVKSGGALEAAIIFFGLWLIKSATKAANDVYRESFDSLDKRLESAFKKYLKFDEGKEVRENAIEIEKGLRLQIKNAKSRLTKFDDLAIYMLIAGAAYLSISAYNHTSPDTMKILKETILEYGKHFLQKPAH
ncbi:hypothetical protein [Cronobacter dublinensis]|uniref:hypothetical protein n=1 Tax=Cronobacter dublinensis TaxID=413497 RepID=UPI000CFB5735|nr:hypothetical protein [Cronobacter dublinensis]